MVVCCMCCALFDRVLLLVIGGVELRFYYCEYLSLLQGTEVIQLHCMCGGRNYDGNT